MKSLIVQRPGATHIEDLPLPDCAPGDVLIKVDASGICGTDVHIYRGEYLGSYPITPGHESAGVVEQIGSEVAGFGPGDEVAFEPNIACGTCKACLSNRQNFCENWQGIGVTRAGSMSEFVVAPEQNVFSTAGIPSEVACFMEPLSCVLHGIQKANITLGDHILILGAGPIGLLLLQAARLLGSTSQTVLERNSARALLAESFGAVTVVHDLDDLDRDSFDVVIDATGSIPLLERTIDFVRYGGTMLYFGVAPTGEEMRIEPFLIFRKGVTIVSSYTSRRNSHQAIEMLRTGAIAVKELVSHRLSLPEFDRGIELLESGDDDVRKVLVLPNG